MLIGTHDIAHIVWGRPRKRDEEPEPRGGDGHGNLLACGTLGGEDVRGILRAGDLQPQRDGHMLRADVGRIKALRDALKAQGLSFK